ncbi:C-type mannose receptor 2-like isoform X2 [Simochromis diagramma]|nr:C-type mannose receptor 2-like isoform X2 [Simochromis diagramma]
MKRCGLILLLLSGYVMVCHLQSDQLVRQLHLVDLQKSWNDAQQYCRDEYIDLAIVNSSALIQEAQKRAGSTEAWIGLSRSWEWSQTGPVQSSWFNMWSPGQPGTDECVTIFSDGSWFTRPCSATYYFVCYDAATNKHILVKNSMTWSDAQSYCRQTYTDLSTITNTQDNSQVASMLTLNYQAWIGLYRKYWTWSNSSTASNLPWGPGQPDNSVNCATIVGSTGSFNSHNCSDQRPFLCSRGESVLCVSAQSGPPGLIGLFFLCRCQTFSLEVSEGSAEGGICRPERPHSARIHPAAGEGEAGGARDQRGGEAEVEDAA